jgi:hypothetical protein
MLACLEDELYALSIAVGAENADIDHEALSRILLRAEYRCKITVLLDERFRAAQQPSCVSRPPGLEAPQVRHAEIMLLSAPPVLRLGWEPPWPTRHDTVRS